MRIYRFIVLFCCCFCFEQLAQDVPRERRRDCEIASGLQALEGAKDRVLAALEKLEKGRPTILLLATIETSLYEARQERARFMRIDPGSVRGEDRSRLSYLAGALRELQERFDRIMPPERK